MKNLVIISCLFFFVFITVNSLNSQTYRVLVETKGWGCVDLNGNFIVKPKYKDIFGFSKTSSILAFKKKKKYKKCDMYDASGNKIIPEKKIKLPQNGWSGIWLLSRGEILRMRVQGDLGGINNKGVIAIPFKYDKLTDFHDGYSVCQRNGKYYVINTDGKEKLIDYENITNINEFREYLSPVEVDDQFIGFIDTLGNMVIKPQFIRTGYFKEGLAWVVTPDNKTGFINEKGEWMVDAKYITVGYFYGGVAWVKTFDNLVGYVNSKGDLLIEPYFNTANHFDPGSGLALVEKDEKWQYIDTLGQTYDYNNITDKEFDFSEGLAVGLKDGEFGYINNKGEWVIRPQFKAANKFQMGFAKVKKKGKWGLIDKEGNWILDPVYKNIGEISIVGMASSRHFNIRHAIRWGKIGVY